MRSALIKLHPSLQHELAQWQARVHAPDVAPAPELEVVVICCGALDELRAAGLRPGHLSESFVVGYAPLSALESIARVDAVKAIHRAPTLRPLLHDSAPAINAPAVWNGAPGYKGTNVIIGIIDDGIDIGHHCFRRPNNTGKPLDDGRSRVLRLWDQTIPAANPNRSPRRFTLPGFNDGNPIPLTRYGLEYTQEELTSSIQSTPLGKPFLLPGIEPPNLDTGVAHGSHVAGIAAGNGNQSDGCHKAGYFIGIAPEADLVVVRFVSGFGHFLDAVLYIVQFAATGSNFPDGKPRPVVVNVSLGWGEADSNPELHKALMDPLNKLLEASPSRAIVAGAGNSAHRSVHARVQLPALNGAKELKFIVPRDAHAREFDLSFTGSTQLLVTLRHLAGHPEKLANPAEAPQLAIVDGHEVVYTKGIARTVAGQQTGAIWFSISRPPKSDILSGEWTLTLSEPAGKKTEVDAWIRYEDHDPCPRFQPPDTSNTINAPARARNVIAVGATDQIGASMTPVQPGQIAYLSSQGPIGVPKEETKPDVVAPGIGIWSVRSRARKSDALSECCVDFYGHDLGTSMASPHVAGVVALMFERNRTLTFDQVRKFLRDSAKRPDETTFTTPVGPLPNERWGFGLVDAAAAVQLVPQSAAAASGVHAGTMVAGDIHEGPPAPMTPDPFSIEPDRSHPVITNPRPAFGDRLRGFEPVLARSPSLQLALALVSAHVDEIRALVSGNRRVAAVWRRDGGPALVRHVLAIDVERSIGEAPIIPAEISGFSIGALLSHLLTMLQRHGGDRLRADVARYRWFVESAPGARLSDLDALIGAELSTG